MQRHCYCYRLSHTPYLVKTARISSAIIIIWDSILVLVVFIIFIITETLIIKLCNYIFIVIFE